LTHMSISTYLRHNIHQNDLEILGLNPKTTTYASTTYSPHMHIIF
jgi:hypothetical protein